MKNYEGWIVEEVEKDKDTIYNITIKNPETGELVTLLPNEDWLGGYLLIDEEK